MKSKNLSKIINKYPEQYMPWLEALKKKFQDFQMVVDDSIAGLAIAIFRKKSSRISVNIFKEKILKMGFMSLANKGGIYLGIQIESTRVGIFNCHLASGTSIKDFQKRQEHLKKLKDYLKT